VSPFRDNPKPTPVIAPVASYIDFQDQNQYVASSNPAVPALKPPVSSTERVPARFDFLSLSDALSGLMQQPVPGGSQLHRPSAQK
jgi:hypothetical protein